MINILNDPRNLYLRYLRLHNTEAQTIFMERFQGWDLGGLAWLAGPRLGLEAWPGWLAWLAGWAGWAGWLAWLACLAGWAGWPAKP